MSSSAPGTVRSGHVSGLHAVTSALAEMRGSILKAGVDDGGGMRLSVLTLVVACADRASGERAGEALERMAVSHPTRAIVLVGDPDGPARIDADVSISCSTTGGGQVCMEMVRLEVGGGSARHLRSVVGPLLLPDVPVHLWVVGAAPLTQALSPDTFELCERVILDSDAYPDPTATLVAVAQATTAVRPAPAIGDLAWSRIRGWRELAGRAFETPELRGFVQGVEDVEVRFAGTVPSAQALLFSGWLRSRLDRPGFLVPAITRIPDGREGGQGELQRVVLRASNRGRRARIEISGDETLRTTAVSVEGAMHSTAATWTVGVEQPGIVALVGAELEEQGPDPMYTAALAAALGESR
ncbi:MAG TPA: glucose-6-phosphate dehydrogenase assembly protein OpcA [Candidatus Dormibacteraeota bacterium]|nr:glucose-6-phosphate dehydrogenase assembly protein OpcA [Candidatus Dormibacteraeota bacterium]